LWFPRGLLWPERSPNFLSSLPAVSHLIFHLHVSCIFFKTGDRRTVRYTVLCGTMLGDGEEQGEKNRHLVFLCTHSAWLGESHSWCKRITHRLSQGTAVICQGHFLPLWNGMQSPDRAQYRHARACNSRGIRYVTKNYIR
jgi:hypothetical protein